MGWHIFGFFEVRQFFIFTVSKRTRMFELQRKSEVFFILKNGSIHKNRECLIWDREKLQICPKVAKMGSIIDWPQNRL